MRPSSLNWFPRNFWTPTLLSRVDFIRLTRLENKIFHFVYETESKLLLRRERGKSGSNGDHVISRSFFYSLSSTSEIGGNPPPPFWPSKRNFSFKICLVSFVSAISRRDCAILLSHTGVKNKKRKLEKYLTIVGGTSEFIACGNPARSWVVAMRSLSRMCRGILCALALSCKENPCTVTTPPPPVSFVCVCVCWIQFRLVHIASSIQFGAVFLNWSSQPARNLQQLNFLSLGCSLPILHNQQHQHNNILAWRQRK